MQDSTHTLTPCFHPAVFPHAGRLLQWTAALCGSWPGPYWGRLRQSDALRCPPGCLQCSGPAGKAQQGHREVSSWTYLHLFPLCCTGSLQLPRRKVEIRPEGWESMSWSEAQSLSLPKWEPLQQLQWRSVLTEVAMQNPLGFLLSSLLNEVWEK